MHVDHKATGEIYFEYILNNANDVFIFINIRLPLKQNSQKRHVVKGTQWRVSESHLD